MLPFLNTLIHPATSANFSGTVYTALYTTSAITATINGVSVSLPSGIKLDIKVTSASATAGLFLLGTPKNVIDISTGIGGSY